MFFCDHVVSLEDFKILASSNSEFHLKIKEILLISREKFYFSITSYLLLTAKQQAIFTYTSLTFNFLVVMQVYTYSDY